MKRINANSMDGAEALKLVQAGQQLECPVCHSQLETIPQNWTSGSILRGITCPVDQKHFLVYSEDKNALRQFRLWLKGIKK